MNSGISAIDYSLIVLYLLGLIAIGLWASRRASRSMESYFLGGRTVSFILLGLAGMTMYIDMAATMMQASFYFIFGIKGFWITFRGAMPLILAFLMVFMGKWLNRSKAMTNAELLELRFGDGPQGHAARLLCALSILVQAVAFCSFLFYGAGVFLFQFLPGVPRELCILIFFAVVLFYTVLAGFYGMVYTDLLQSLLIAVVVVWIVGKAMMCATPQYFQNYTDPTWLSMSFDGWTEHIPQKFAEFKPIGTLLIFWTASSLLLGFAVPHDAWTSQKFYAAKNERESSLIACTWIVTYSIRFAMFMAIGIIAVGIRDKIQEPEMAFPAILETFFPVGLKGLMISALLAAGMSAINGSVNSTAVYFVNDIYKKHLVRRPSEKHLVKIGYLTTFSIMLTGLIIGLYMPSISTIWGWIFMGLFTGLLASNILKWFWWRFNGMGYALGMACGVAAAILQNFIFKDSFEFVTFCFILAVSAAGAIIGTFLGKPTDTDVLINFYKKIRPFGFWSPIRRLVDPKTVSEIRHENRRDLLLLIPAIVWQIMIAWAVTTFVAKKWDSLALAVAIVLALSLLLYKFWYKNLKITHPADLEKR